MSDLPTGLITYLFTDIEGSTRLWQQHPNDMRGVLARHDDLLTSGIEQHGGEVVRPRGEGDSIFAVFVRATDAVAAACTVQQMLLREPWPLDIAIRVRMALHTGESELRAHDYYGTTVNRCARLRGIAHGGQAILSLATAALVRDAMPEGVSLRDLGSHGLKDFQDPEQVFQLLHPDLPSEFPPLKSMDASLHNLPVQLTSFIGRESQILEISELFDDARCVTLTGIGGSGKTRLALEVGQQRLESYPDGVWFVDLSTITDESLVHREVASALGVQEEALSQHIQSKNMLLILDNCEHLLDICAQSASTWLAQAPNVHLLATSREALGIPGEVIRRISSLSVPDESNVSPETLMECEATRLFAERASSAHGAFEVTQENSSAIAQIANRLDGIPLAIELAAARVRMLSPEQIASRLDDRFRLLTGGSRTAMPRQRTLQAAIDWSYHSLEDEEARLFDKLSVFRGGFTLEAVEHVGVGEGDDPLYVMDALFQLVDKSLVTVAHSGSDGDARYRLLETLRHYGGERLAESGQAEDTRRMHAEYYLEMIHGVQSDLWDSGSKEAVGLLVANHDNLRGALDWALDAGETETALRLVGDLGYLWMLHRHVNEGNEKATRAFALAEQQGDAPADAMASALFAAEIVAIQLPDFERGMAYIEESIRLYREVQDDTGLARSTYARGVMPWAVGDIDQARGMLEEAMSLDNLNADPWSQGWCHSLLSSIAASRGQYEGVLDTFQQTINALQSRGDYWGTAFARLMAGSVAKDLGNYSVATTHFEEGLPLARDSGDRSCVGASLSGLATTVWLQDDHERALELQQEGIAEYKEAGSLPGISWSVGCLRAGMRTPGDVWWLLGLYAEAWEMPEDIRAKVVIAESLYSVGRIANIQGDQDRASDILNQCLTLHQDIGYKRGVELALLETASVAIAQNDPHRAARLLGAAESAAKITAPTLTDYERLEFERVRAELRPGLESDTFTERNAEGAAMSIAEATSFALG